MTKLRFLIECEIDTASSLRKALERLKRQTPNPSVGQLEAMHRRLEAAYADDAENALSDALQHKEYLIQRVQVTKMPAVEVRSGWGRSALDFLRRVLPLDV